MHGLGNDFMVIDGVSQEIQLTEIMVRRFSDRKRGVGFDQLLLVEASDDPEFDFVYRIFNADGYEVEQCGNGARCFARFVHDIGLTDKKSIAVKTKAGPLQINLEENQQVSVDMGAPIFELSKIPFIAKTQASAYEILLPQQTIEASVLSMGNPHCVIRVDSVEDAAVDEIGRELSTHRLFPNGVNVGFMEIVDSYLIKLRVYERGVGETEACGSGACAAVVAGRIRALLRDQVTVRLRGGDLTVNWPGGTKSVRLTGPVAHVFDGEIALGAS